MNESTNHNSNVVHITIAENQALTHENKALKERIIQLECRLSLKRRIIKEQSKLIETLRLIICSSVKIKPRA
jgi:hypothetical protein